MLKQLITTIIIIQNTINIPPNRAAKNALSVIGTETLCTETLICFMILLFITLFHTCQQYCSFIDRQETYVFKFLTLFTILSCLVCSSLDIVHITIHFIECSFLQSKWESIIASFADITYFIAKYDTTLRLLHLISKHSILFGIAMITNQCFYIGIILEEYFRIDKINYTEAILILFSARALENLVNALVLWLMLAINLKLYFKLCGICHTKMQNCCKICISSKIMFGANVHSNIFTEKSVNSTVRTDVETKIKLLHPIDER
eukprot:251729_1